MHRVRGCWDMGLLDAALTGKLTEPSVQFEHVMLDGPVPAGASGIFVLHGGTCHDNLEDTKKWIEPAGPSILVHVADECHTLDSTALLRDGDQLWQQVVNPVHAVRTSRALLSGWRSETVATIAQLRTQEIQRDLLWSFSGQVTHPTRCDCAAAASARSDGVLNCTGGFGQGLEYDGYTKLMLRSKVVLCPSGPITADTMRMYEALEAGCLVVCNRRAPSQPNSVNYWEHVLGFEPVPCVDDWRTDLPVMLDDWAAHPERLRAATECVQEWWKWYKINLQRGIERDARFI
jgi:hypothetical protein